MFKNLFRQKTKGNISGIKVDMHSHLIPGIDDGTQSIDQSLEIIKKFRDLGYEKIITTPHIMGDFYKNTPENIGQGLQLLKEAISKNHISISIEAAAEYYLDEFFVKDLKSEKKLLTFGKNRILLFELPFISPPIQMDEAIFIMQTQGYKPLLAHPERYQFYQGNINDLKKLREKGVLLQINLSSLLGYYSKPAEKLAKSLIDNDMVDFVGSDIHNIRQMDFIENCLCGKWGKKLARLVLQNNTLLDEK
jgi:protein-tyrosine phosphatase